MDLMLKKTRVFWHEFGHFVAAYCNQLFFGKFGTESITINRQEYYGGIDFKGYHTPNKPPNYKSTDPIKHPASMVASLVYGCYFQCIFQGNQLRSCFDEERNGVHGFDDYGKVWTVARLFGLNDKERQDLESCIYEQFQNIRTNREFQALFQTNITEFIEKDDDVISIDVKALPGLFRDFLDQHCNEYKKFVERLEIIFENHQYRRLP